MFLSVFAGLPIPYPKREFLTDDDNDDNNNNNHKGSGANQIKGNRSIEMEERILETMQDAGGQRGQNILAPRM